MTQSFREQFHEKYAVHIATLELDESGEQLVWTMLENAFLKGKQETLDLVLKNAN